MADTMDDKVAQVSGGQADRVAAMGAMDQAQMTGSIDLVNQLAQLTQQQEQLNATEPASLQKDLLSIPGILAILGGGAAMASGDQGMQEGGAAFLQNFLGARQGAVSGFNEGLAQQKKNLNDAINQQRTRLTTLLQSQPDMFLNPETGLPAVDPRLLGYAATGLMIPIDPSTNHAMKARLKSTEELLSLGKELFLTGDTAETRQRGLRIIGRAHGIQWDDRFYQVAATMNEEAMYTHLMQEGYFTPTSMMNAMVKARSEGLSIVDVVDMFVSDKTRGIASGGRPTMASAQLEALDLYAQRLQANPEYNDPMLSQEEKWALAFPAAEDQKYVELLRKGFAEEGISSETMMRQINSNMALITTLEQVGGVPEVFLEQHGLTQKPAGWQSMLAVKMTEYAMPALAGLDRQQGQISAVALRDDLAASLQRDPNLSGYPPELISSVALQVVLAAKQDLVGDFGILDSDALRAKIEEYKNDPSKLYPRFKYEAGE